jgi:hypothetical protein
MDLGFFNLGRFSVRYRHAFGESPSATMKRCRGWRADERMYRKRSGVAQQGG